MNIQENVGICPLLRIKRMFAISQNVVIVRMQEHSDNVTANPCFQFY